MRLLTRCFPAPPRAEDFTKCIDCIQTGKVNPLPWITHTGELANFEADFQTWMKPENGVIKAVVCFP